MPRDQVDHVIAVQSDEPVLRCAACGAPVTRPAWAMAVNGRHEYVFFNPAGRVFRICCFREAPGVTDVSPCSRDFTWFSGYGWRIVGCRGCGAHLGWRYEALPADDGAAAAGEPVFFGLIRAMLTAGPLPHGSDGP